MLVIGTDVDDVVFTPRRGAHRPAALETPQEFAGLSMQAVQSAIDCADINRIAIDKRRRRDSLTDLVLPDLASSQRLKRVDETVCRAKVHVARVRCRR